MDKIKVLICFKFTDADKIKLLSWFSPLLAAVWRDSVLQVLCDSLIELLLVVFSVRFIAPGVKSSVGTLYLSLTSNVHKA